MGKEENEVDLLHGMAAIADCLGIGERQAEYLATIKEIPTFKIGRRVCARRSSLKEWLRKREAEGKADA